MRAGLLTKECIDAPSAIDPDFDAQLFKGDIQINDISGVHAHLTAAERNEANSRQLTVNSEKQRQIVMKYECKEATSRAEEVGEKSGSKAAALQKMQRASAQHDLPDTG
jgi:hypothetical protein